MKNPLEEYRRAQRDIRREFDAFTRVHCPTCVTPCCIRPARVGPVDILLAEGTGWRAQVELVGGKDAAQRAAADQARALTVIDQQPPEPCEHLGATGCTFPKDLRPFGCTTFICPVMYRELDRKALDRMRRGIRELTRRHEKLMQALALDTTKIAD